MAKHGFLCTCNKCMERSLGRGNRGKSVAADAALAATSFVGFVTNPGDQPNTDDLNDVHTQQVTDTREQSIEQGTRNSGGRAAARRAGQRRNS